MTYGHLQADCLYTRISSGPNARYRVWEAFAFTFFVYWRILGQQTGCPTQSWLDGHPCMRFNNANAIVEIRLCPRLLYLTLQVINQWYSAPHVVIIVKHGGVPWID